MFPDGRSPFATGGGSKGRAKRALVSEFSNFQVTSTARLQRGKMFAKVFGDDFGVGVALLAHTALAGLGEHGLLDASLEQRLSASLKILSGGNNSTLVPPESAGKTGTRLETPHQAQLRRGLAAPSPLGEVVVAAHGHRAPFTPMVR